MEVILKGLVTGESLHESPGLHEQFMNYGSNLSLFSSADSENGGVELEADF